MGDQITRINHYVPVWYQQGFLKPGRSKYHYFDMFSDETLTDGRVITRNAFKELGPKRCFAEHDLYTTHFGGLVNDEVETYLFGSVDDRGAKAVRAFASGDPKSMHHSFRDFFEYLDAQKLRTPKGLDWIKSRYPTLSQLELMVEMQGLRFMHCTMWTEGVREIVSAETSDVKFIVSDNPLTVYNAAVSPNASACRYPNDPLIEQAGTQTVFALDSNTCLILTNLEYAKEPRSCDLTAPRTNARYRGQSLVRTDAFIRKRRLSRDEVTAVNVLLKARARRYVAAAERDWLYPERHFAGTWQDIAGVLLPKDDLWQFGGEIYVGYADGSATYQDEFGRTTGAHDYLRRKVVKTDLSPNDPCGCGSGRKFKNCCKPLAKADRPSWEVYGIRERNLMFCRVVKGILGLSNGRSWDEVRRTLSTDQVKEIHEAFGSLWPEDTDMPALLTRPDDKILRGLYLGPTDPKTAPSSILALLAYFDEIVVAHPFLNPTRIKPEFSPTKSPAKHRAQTLKNALLLLLLEPFIDAGWVHLVPDLGDFNSEFGRSTLGMADARARTWKPKRSSLDPLMELLGDDNLRTYRQLPAEALKRIMRKSSPNASDSVMELAATEFKAQLEQDPVALLQTFEPGDEGSQFIFLKGFGLEVALFLASAMGCFLYTDVEASWEQLQLYARDDEPPWADQAIRTTESLDTMAFPLEINPETLFQMRSMGRLGSMRDALRRMFRTPPTPDMPVGDWMADELKKMTREWAATPTTMRADAKLGLAAPANGFHRNDVRRLLLTFGRAKEVRTIPFALFVSRMEFN